MWTDGSGHKAEKWWNTFSWSLSTWSNIGAVALIVGTAAFGTALCFIPGMQAFGSAILYCNWFYNYIIYILWRIKTK